MASKFYDNVVTPFYANPDMIAQALGTSGMGPTMKAGARYGSFLDWLENSYAQPTAEPGPRFDVQGPVFQQARPVAGPPGPPYYLARPQEEGPHLERGGPMGPPEHAIQRSGTPGVSQVDISHYGPGGGNLPFGEGAPTSVPPPGDPERNEYQTMVKDYLARLRQPADFPRPTPLTKMQMFNIVLHPERAQELREQYQGADYKQRLMEFQYTQGREAQAAEMANQLAVRQEDLQRRDAERSWFRESAMANAGAPVPPGYKWKNPELQAVWQQKFQEKTDIHARTKKYLENTTAAEEKLKSRQGRVDKLFADKLKVQGLLANPQLLQERIMAQGGAGDEDMLSMIEGLKDEAQRIENERRVISIMDDNDYQDFIQLDGATQQQVIEDYLAALGQRQTPGANVVTPQP